MAPPLRIISTAVELDALCVRLAAAPEIALDTEFHGEKSYWPKLMLVQLATRSEIVLVDPLAKEIGVAELGRLLEAIRGGGALVVGHAVSHDLEILLRASRCLPVRAFDTQVAAAFVGLGHQVGLGRLLAARLTVDVEKRYSMADWSKRPLPEGQLEYAAADVEHLLPLADDLRAELERRGRSAWVTEECARLVDPASYGDRDPEAAWRSVKKAPRAGTREARVLRELAAERERIAKEMDRPRQYVLPDELLVDLARRAPRHPRDLHSDTHRRGSPGLQQHAARWLEAVRRSTSAALDAAEPYPPTLSAAQESLLTVAKMLVAQHANSDEIAPPLVSAFLDELPALLRSPPRDRAELETRLGVSGWRAELIGELLWALLSGRLRAQVSTGPEGLELSWSRES